MVFAGRPLAISRQVAQADAVLYATGRVPNVKDLGLEAVGVAQGGKGEVIVNAHYQTNVPSIYAVGDIIGFPALASTAMEQGRIAMIHAFGLEFARDLSNLLPSGIYTIPECSMVGPTERDLVAQARGGGSVHEGAVTGVGRTDRGVVAGRRRVRGRLARAARGT